MGRRRPNSAPSAPHCPLPTSRTAFPMARNTLRRRLRMVAAERRFAEGAEDVQMSWTALGPQAWAAEQFGSVMLGDRRLNQRVVAVAGAMAADPSGSIPRQNKGWAQTKGAYRLFDHPEATFEALSEPHWRRTRAACAAAAAGAPVTLLIQDTT